MGCSSPIAAIMSLSVALINNLDERKVEKDHQNKKESRINDNQETTKVGGHETLTQKKEKGLK